MSKLNNSNKWLKIEINEGGRYWIIDKKTKDCLAAFDCIEAAQTYLDGYEAGRGKK